MWFSVTYCKLQLVHVLSIKEVKSSFLMFHLKLSSQGRCGSLKDGFDLQCTKFDTCSETNQLRLVVPFEF